MRSSSAPGFIGCEVAASLRGMGVDVVAGGTAAGRRWRRCSASRSVSWWPGCTAPKVSMCDAASESPDVRGTEKVEKVVLSDGAELDADLVVVGIGSRPATDWLDGTGIEVDNGVVCDDARPRQRATCGRSAMSRHGATPAGHQVRVEHWSNVADQARALVPAMLGLGCAVDSVTVPYFWSDQYDVKIQCLGEPEATDTVHVVEDDGRKFLAFYERDGVVAGVVGGGMPGKVMKVRAKIAAGAPDRASVRRLAARTLAEG